MQIRKYQQNQLKSMNSCATSSCSI
uniref:Uncharacterized protein n=1 Tax=Arundo donax TaxID=35708 RepID=A0A0A8Y968_ARUDO